MKLLDDPEPVERKPSTLRARTGMVLSNNWVKHPELAKLTHPAILIKEAGAAHKVGERLGMLIVSGESLYAVLHTGTGLQVASAAVAVAGAAVLLGMKALPLIKRLRNGVNGWGSAAERAERNHAAGAEKAREAIEALKGDLGEKGAARALRRQLDHWRAHPPSGEQEAQVNAAGGAGSSALALKLANMLRGSSVETQAGLLRGMNEELDKAEQTPETGGGTTAPGAGTSAKGGKVNAVDANPEDVRALAAALDTFNAAIEAAKAELQRASAESSDGWADSKGDGARGQIEELLSSVQVDDTVTSIRDTVNQYAAKLDELMS